jgi:hypothetical protein
MSYAIGEKGRRMTSAAGEATFLERLGFVPDAWQARVLESGAKRVMLNCSRQCGKSTVTAVKAVEQTYTQAESLTLVVGPSARQSGEFLRKAAQLARKLGVARKGDGDNEMSLLFPNGSRIVGLPGSEGTIRGFSAVNLLLVDEASRVPDELYMAVLPMLVVSGGSLWLMSTPNGKQGFFWETWERGGAEWEKVQVTAHECPRIGREALERERETMGDRNFRQEYLCEFGETEDGVFRQEDVQGAIDPTIEPWPWTEEGGVFA